MFERDYITFQPLRHDDLHLMLRWMRNADVSRWYSPAPLTLAEIQARYGPRIDGHKPIDGYIVLYDETPVAYVQAYAISHEPSYAAALEVDQDAVGVDVFIGEPEFRYRGFGPILLQEFVRRIVFAAPGTTYCVIAPAVSNTSAIRAYQKAGFRHIKTVPVPGEDEPEHVMIIWPDEVSVAIERLERERST